MPNPGSLGYCYNIKYYKHSKDNAFPAGNFHTPVEFLEFEEGFNSTIKLWRNYVGGDESDVTFHVKKIKLPNSLTQINNYAFSGYKALNEINIPNSVLSIGEQAFFQCVSLKELAIPSSVQSMYVNALQFCRGLKYLKIPANLYLLTTSNINPINIFCKGLNSLQKIDIDGGWVPSVDVDFSDSKNLSKESFIDFGNKLGNGNRIITYPAGMSLTNSEKLIFTNKGYILTQ